MADSPPDNGSDSQKKCPVESRGALFRPDARPTKENIMSEQIGSLLIVPGDGIGPEAMSQVQRIIDWMGDKLGKVITTEYDLVGGAAIDAHGVPLHDDTMAKAHTVDAVLLGAGGNVERFDDHRPQIFGKVGFVNPFFIAYAPNVVLKEA